MIKKLLIIVFIVNFSYLSIKAQSGWIPQNSGTNVSLNSIYMLDASIGYIAGNSGKLLKTTNGGINWLSLNSGVITNLYSVFFLNSSSGFSGGSGSILLRTLNGGLNWIAVSINQYSYRLNYLQFTNLNTGYMLGLGNCGQYGLPCTIFCKTNDGGNNWASTWPETGLSYDMYFINSNAGFYSFNSWVCRTLNGGNNWFTLFLGNNYQPNDFFNFVDNNTGWVSAYNNYNLTSGIFRTTNSGYNWSVVYETPSSVLPDLCDGYFVNSTTGYVTSYSGKIMKSFNGGLNWAVQYFDAAKHFKRIIFLDQNTGYVIGDDGIILKTTNAGEPIGIKKISDKIPSSYLLYQNYPNPFNPNANIKYQLVNSGHVMLVVYDIWGRDLTTLVNEVQSSGAYQVDFSGNGYSSGVYFYRMEIDGRVVDTKKMILLK